MKGKRWVLWLTLILVTLMLMSGGCGGDGNSLNPTDPNNPGGSTNFNALEGTWIFDSSKDSGGTMTVAGYGTSSLSLLQGSAEIRNVSVSGSSIELDMRCAFDWRINVLDLVYENWGARTDDNFENDIKATIEGNKIHLFIPSSGTGGIAISTFDVTLISDNEIYVEEKGTAIEYGSYSAYYHLKKTGGTEPEPEPDNPDLTRIYAKGSLSASCINRGTVYTGGSCELTLTIRHYASDPADVVYINTGDAILDMYSPPNVTVRMDGWGMSSAFMTFELGNVINMISKYTRNGNVYTGYYEKPGSSDFYMVEIELEDDAVLATENSRYNKATATYKSIRSLKPKCWVGNSYMGFYFKPSNALSVLDQHAALPVDDNWLPDQKLSWDETTTNPLAKANIWYNTAQKGTGYHDKNKGYKKSDLYAVDLNLPTNADKGKPVFAIEDGVVSQIKTGDGYVEIEHNKLLVTYSAVVNQHAVSEDKLLYSIPSGVRELPLVVPRWYSGYMHMEIDENVKDGQVIAKGQRIGLISDIAINALPTDAHHLHFAVYDKDGYSFSPYILSSKYKLISYGGHGGWIAQDQRDHEYFPLNDLGYRNNLP